MQSPTLHFTQAELNAFKLGMSQVRPVHLIIYFDGDNSYQVERNYPQEYALIIWGPDNYVPICKHCKNPQPRWYAMDELIYGLRTMLCGNCEQISYLKG